MTDQQGATPADAQPPATGGQDEDTTAEQLLADAVDDEPLGEPGKRALQSERDARKALEKQLADATAKVKQFEDAQLSEQEKLTKAAAEAQQQAESATRELARYKVIAELGVPADLQEFVVGGTEDEIRDRAAKLMGAFTARPTGVPKPDPSQGAHPGGTPTFADQATDALAKGDVKSAIAFKAAQMTNPQK